MGKGADLARTAKRIEAALRNYVEAGEHDKVFVFEAYPGHLDAVVGSNRFRGMGVTKRQETIWKYLRKTLDEADVHDLWGVYPLDLDEYEEEYALQPPGR